MLLVRGGWGDQKKRKKRGKKGKRKKGKKEEEEKKKDPQQHYTMRAKKTLNVPVRHAAQDSEKETKEASCSCPATHEPEQNISKWGCTLIPPPRPV
jgi:FtsZ-interacting cell division protein ZipA